MRLGLLEMRIYPQLLGAASRPSEVAIIEAVSTLGGEANLGLLLRGGPPEGLVLTSRHRTSRRTGAISSTARYTLAHLLLLMARHLAQLFHIARSIVSYTLAHLLLLMARQLPSEIPVNCVHRTRGMSLRKGVPASVKSGPNEALAERPSERPNAQQLALHATIH